MQRYSDYLRINQDFVDVFTENADRTNEGAWKGFIPHKAMLNLLDTLLRALARDRISDCKSLWVHGAYGTGKTFVQFVLKHMLEDPWEEVAAYFKQARLGQNRLAKLHAIRERGKGLVVFRSSSAEIDSNRKLMAELQQAVKLGLQAQGFKSSTTPTLYDLVVQRLSDPGSPFNWGKAFERHRGTFPDFGSARQVIERLQSSPRDLRDSITLMDRVAGVLDDEGFLVFNDLPWVLFIWDEFTDFFGRNNPTSGLQELAHLTREVPFYLQLITHRPPQTLQAEREKEWRKLTDRFHLIRYDMEEVTAYTLMGRAMHIREDQEEAWKSKREALWDRVKGLSRFLAGENGRPSDFKDLIPIHPYAAMLVSRISREFSSSQRTLFRFLKRRDAGAFPEFLQEYPKGDWLWYTADALWDYFFGSQDADLPQGFREAISYYAIHSESIENTQDHLRAFKAVMLLLALSKEVPNVKELKPTLRNLRQVFYGTSLERGIKDIMQTLVERDIVRSLDEGIGRTLYTIPQGGLDIEQIQKIKRELPPFEAEVELRGQIGESLNRVLSDVGEIRKRRIRSTTVSATTLGRRRERVEPHVKPYQIGMVIVASKTGADLTQAEQIVEELVAPDKPIAYVLVALPFDEARWEAWQTDRAHEQYYQQINDLTNSQVHRKRALDRVREWMRQLRGGTLIVLFGGKRKTAEGMRGLEQVLDEILKELFPCQPERIMRMATLYRESYGVSGAEIGLGATERVGNPYKSLIHQLKRDGLWPDHGATLSADLRPEHPLCIMQGAIDKLFHAQEKVTIKEIWETLQRPPFGLIPSPLGIVLMGLLLRPYCTGYYYYDGVNTLPLNPNKMSELITNVMHGSDRNTVTLSRITLEMEEFCHLIRDIFGLPEDRTRYPDNAGDSLRDYLKEVGFPIWSLSHFVSSQGREPLQSITRLAALLRPAHENDQALTQDAIAAVLPFLQADADVLGGLVRESRFAEGMRRFIESADPELPDLGQALGLDLVQLMRKLGKLMNEDTWLWQESQVVERLP